MKCGDRTRRACQLVEPPGSRLGHALCRRNGTTVPPAKSDSASRSTTACTVNRPGSRASHVGPGRLSGKRTRPHGFAGQKRPHLGLPEAAVTAGCPDAADPPSGRPPGDGLRINAEESSHLTWCKQSFPCFHVASLGDTTPNHVVHGQRGTMGVFHTNLNRGRFLIARLLNR